MDSRAKLVRVMLIVLGSLAVLATVVACGGAPRVEWELSISGAVGNPVSVSYTELAKMEQVELEDLLMEKSMGEDEIHSWSGPALEVLFEQAQAGNLAGGITAVAADGYAIDIPEDELEGAIIALKKDGEWITDAEPDKGPIRLVCPETPANRWVFQIKEIVIN